MKARRNQPHRRRTAAVHAGLRIALGAGIEQEAENLDGVLWRLLPERFDAVGANVVKQRRVMLAGRAGANQAGVAAKKTAKRRKVAVANRIGGSFEPRNRRIQIVRLTLPVDEVVPGLEMVICGDDVTCAAAGIVRCEPSRLRTEWRRLPRFEELTMVAQQCGKRGLVAAQHGTLGSAPEFLV